MKPHLILCALIVFCMAACKKNNIAPAKTKLQLHLDSLAVTFAKTTWDYNGVIIKLGGNEQIWTPDVLNPYNLAFDDKSNVVASSAIYGAGTSGNISASYKLTNENGLDYITFYNASGSAISKAYINFPGNNATNISYAQEIDLYFADQGTLTPVLSEPDQQNYASTAKAVQYYRSNN